MKSTQALKISEDGNSIIINPTAMKDGKLYKIHWLGTTLAYVKKGSIIDIYEIDESQP